ncbi:MAG: CPBP family intramembrane metalloprotease [Fidelibacterota bacterium]|nr:MAG: CPBP family intramembrane metalloprotease [Candidatus Neomarinimicrobiota bacterium]
MIIGRVIAMRNLSLSLRIYIGLVIGLAILAAISIFLPAFDEGMIPQQELPASKPVLALINAAMVLVVYGGLGYLGYVLSRKLGFADIWDPEVSNRQRFLTPGLIGIAAGVFLILADAVFSRFHTLGPLPHPRFPFSILASASAGIGEELIFRLFFIPVWMWLISSVVLSGKGRNPVFWIVTVLSALAFAFGHLPAVMVLFEFPTVMDVPPALLAEIILLNGVISIFAAYYFRKYGFLAAVGIHFWTDIVWHVVWGVM